MDIIYRIHYNQLFLNITHYKAITSHNTKYEMIDEDPHYDAFKVNDHLHYYHDGVVTLVSHQ